MDLITLISEKFPQENYKSLGKGIFSKKYLYYSKNLGWKLKSLNLVQRLARNIFGFYKNTHLKNIIKQLKVESLINLPQPFLDKIYQISNQNIFSKIKSSFNLADSEKNVEISGDIENTQHVNFDDVESTTCFKEALDQAKDLEDLDRAFLCYEKAIQINPVQAFSELDKVYYKIKDKSKIRVLLEKLPFNMVYQIILNQFVNRPACFLNHFQILNFFLEINVKSNSVPPKQLLSLAKIFWIESQYLAKFNSDILEKNNKKIFSLIQHIFKDYCTIKSLILDEGNWVCDFITQNSQNIDWSEILNNETKEELICLLTDNNIDRTEKILLHTKFFGINNLKPDQRIFLCKRFASTSDYATSLILSEINLNDTQLESLVELLKIFILKGPYSIASMAKKLSEPLFNQISQGQLQELWEIVLKEKKIDSIKSLVKHFDKFGLQNISKNDQFLLFKRIIFLGDECASTLVDNLTKFDTQYISKAELLDFFQSLISQGPHSAAAFINNIDYFHINRFSEDEKMSLYQLVINAQNSIFGYIGQNALINNFNKLDLKSLNNRFFIANSFVDLGLGLLIVQNLNQLNLYDLPSDELVEFLKKISSIFSYGKSSIDYILENHEAIFFKRAHEYFDFFLHIAKRNSSSIDSLSKNFRFLKKLTTIQKITLLKLFDSKNYYLPNGSVWEKRYNSKEVNSEDFFEKNCTFETEQLKKWKDYCNTLLQEASQIRLNYIKKLGILTDIFNYRNSILRYEFTRELFSIEEDKLKVLTEYNETFFQKNGANVSKMKFRLHMTGIFLSKVVDMRHTKDLLKMFSKKNSFLDDTKKFDAWINLLNLIILYTPYKEGEIQNILLILNTLLNKTNKDFVKEVLSLTSILEMFGKKSFLDSCIETKSYETFFAQQFGALFDLEEIPDLLNKYNSTILKLKDWPNIYTYLASINSLNVSVKQEVKIAFKSYMIALLHQNFPLVRYMGDNSPHIATLLEFDEVLLDRWKQCDEIKVEGFSKECSVIDSDDPMDLLTVGTKVHGSCLKLNGNPDRLKSLVSYLMNGEIKPIIVKSKDRWIARSMLFLMWDKKKKSPVLILEKLYFNQKNKTIKKAILNFATEKAKKMGVPLVSKTWSKNNQLSRYENAVSHLGGLAPYMYCDAAGGLMDGKAGFEISDLFQIC